MAAWITSGTLCLLALLHSALGERLLLRPLFAAGLGPTPIGASLARRTLRFAWHLTSVAWLALAWLAVRVGPPELAVVGAMMTASGAIALVAARGRHFAWALLRSAARPAWWGLTRHAWPPSPGRSRGRSSAPSRSSISRGRRGPGAVSTGWCRPSTAGPRSVRREP